jgi:hypothetical protein
MGTEIFSNLPWLAILIAGIAYFGLGAIWYSVLFRNAWIKASGVNVNDPNMKKGVGQIMLTSLLLMMIASLGIAMFLAKIPGNSWMTGAKVGLVAGVCFSATAICISYLYEKRPWMLHFINSAYNVAGCVVAGIVIVLMR